jgi:hypothetical protein
MRAPEEERERKEKVWGKYERQREKYESIL